MPRLAVNLLVLNGASVLRRCLMPLKGVVDELVVVDTGSTDGTKKVLEEIAHDLGLARFYYERLHTFSSDFFTDEAVSFRKTMPGPFTGRRVCADWAKARNLILDNTTADYVLKLDADDEVVSPPENILRTIDCLDARTELELVASPYEIYDGKGNLEWLSMYDRIWRRGAPAGLRWTMPMHEYLDPRRVERTLLSVQGLRVRDWRDSPGDGVRIAHRNLKVLLHDCESGRYGKTISSADDLRRDLVYRFTLAHEAANVFPSWSRELLVGVVNRLAPGDAGMLSDCHYHEGRSHEAEESWQGAVEAYLRADETSPHNQALLRALALMDRLDRGLRLVDMRFAGERARLRETVLTRTGMDYSSPWPLNCDLKLLDGLRTELVKYGTLIFHPPGWSAVGEGRSAP